MIIIYVKDNNFGHEDVDVTLTKYINIYKYSSNLMIHTCIVTTTRCRPNYPADNKTQIVFFHRIHKFRKHD